MGTNTYSTFISYRRDGGANYAARLYDYLDMKGFTPFYDISGMESGRFDEQLRIRVINANNYILILSKHALDRCNDEKDWVRKEIELAIQNSLNIIVLQEDGFEYPIELPESIQDITKYQAIMFDEYNVAHKYEFILPMLLREENDFELYDPYIGKKKAKITGSYITKYEDDDNGRIIVRKAEATLRQIGNRVYGTTNFGSKQKWALQGRVYNKKQIAGVYHATSALDNGFGTFFLEINSPSIFEGFWTGYDNVNKKITSGRYQFRRKYNNFEVRKTTREDLPRIISIADKQLGKNYVNEATLIEIIDEATIIDCVSVIDKETNKVVGFCIYDVYDYPKVKEICRKDVPELKFDEKIGYIKTIAISDKYSGLGIGSKLLNAVLKILEDQGIHHFFSSAWKHAGKINIEHLLVNHGFVKWEEIPHYWYEASIKEGFSCPQCGNPCHCSCVFFIKI